MKLTRLVALFGVVALFAVAACEDTGTPPRPDPPPQISTGWYYTKTTNSNGLQTSLQSNDAWDARVLSTGELWIGNQAGVAIYPGPGTLTRSRAYDEQTGLSNPKIRRIAEYDGWVYMATWGGGITAYDMQADTFRVFRASPTGLTDDSVGDIKVYNDRIYFATNKGVAIYNPIADTWTRFQKSNPNGLLVSFVSSIDIAMTPRGEERMYGSRVEYGVDDSELATVGMTMQRIPGQVIRYTTVNSAMASPNVSDVLYDADRDLWLIAFATEGVAEVDMNTSSWNYLTMEHGLPSNNIYQMAIVDGVLWVGTQNGVARRLSVDGGFQGYNRGGGLKADRVRNLYSDDPDRIWLSYVESGVGTVNPASAE